MKHITNAALIAAYATTVILHGTHMTGMIAEILHIAAHAVMELSHHIHHRH